MRRYPEIESLGRRYLELRASRADSVGGIDLVAARGSVCIKCGGGPGTIIKTGPYDKPNRQKWVEVCVDCREPWQGEPVEIMSRWVSSTTRTDGLEERICRNLDEWRVISRVIEMPARRGTDGHRFAPGRWEFSVKCFLIYSLPQWSSYPRVVNWGEEHEEDHVMRELFTLKRVRHSIPRAKSVLEDRARAEGILR